MRLDEILSEQSISPETAGRLRGFDSLCDQLCVLTEQENEDVLRHDDISDVSLSLKKAALLKSFEQKSSEILDLLTHETPDNRVLQSYILNKISALQDKLKANLGLQMHVMGKIQERLEGYTPEENETCH